MANLITAQEVIELAFAENSNMREESIPQTTIGIAEIKYIRPAFGAMYALLADKYADFTNEYVKPALAYFVKCEMISSIAIDMSNSGVAVANPQYQSAASDKQRQRLYDSEMSKAKTLLDYALSYIAVHSEEFPDYSGPISKKSYRVGGILLGNERVATSIMGEAFKAEYERYLREMQEINEVVVDATEDVSKALIEVNVAIEVANTATEKTEEATQKTEETISKAEDAIKRANTAAENAEKVGEDIQCVEKEIQDIKENAVKPDDYYPKMSVGFSNNLIGRGEATAAEFTYRPTNGKDPIEDEVARVTKIKGNSVVWNQLLVPTFIEGDQNVFIDNGGVPKGHRFALVRSVADGECYYIPSEGIFNYSLGTGGYANIFTNSHDVDNDYVMVYSVGKSGYVQLIDLTIMFGAGNEPSTIEEFYARIPSGIDTTAYNKGEIINLNTEAIKAVGFNQFNGSYARVIVGETYYLSGTYTNIGFATEIGGVTEGITIPEDKLYKPTQDGYIYAEGTDICINLSHTGWKNGTYEPYREFTREIPVIRKYFPDGMKKAGNAFDSIEWDSSKQKWVAVQRIGVVDLGDLSWSYGYGMFTGEGINVAPGLNLLCTKYPAGYNDKNIRAHSTINGYIFVYDSSYSDATTFKAAMQGVMLYYELAEPIVTEIEEEYLNFDYDVEDFGTEEALSSVPSAPFSADIIYKFNAVDSIRQNRLDIKALQDLVATLQSQVASLQASNVEA